MMRCLLVEDEPDRINMIAPELKKILGPDGVQIAMDRDAAAEMLTTSAFDLVVLDQRIPSAAGQLDPDVLHGRAVFDLARSTAPHTPVYFLTGLPMEDEYVDTLIAEGTKLDVWGTGVPISLVRRFKKLTMAPFYDAVADLQTIVRATDDIEINRRGAIVDLSSDEERLLRVFTRRHGGVCADVNVMSGGLSGSRVIRTNVVDANGQVRLAVASKLGHHGKIADERSRFNAEVVRLPAGTYAPLIPDPETRVGTRQGAFYRLLQGYDRPLFEVLKNSDLSAARCVRAVREAQQAWYQSAVVETRTVGDLLKLIIKDSRLDSVHRELDGLQWEKLEQRQISVKLCTRHGDLHGENVLANARNQAMMIDYGAVEHMPSAIDAITLELSPFLHPHGRRESLRWSPSDGAIDWFNRDAFANVTAIPQYVVAAREWAHSEAFGEREVIACAYAYVAGQLQFASTDRPLARALLTNIIDRSLSI